MSLRQIETVSLRAQALSAIRTGIVLGEIKPGVIYSAPSIAAQLGVSPTPVREAMTELAAEGVVTAVRNKGFRIAEITDGDLDEIFQLRVMLEAPSVAQLTGLLDDPTLDALEGAINSMKAASERQDLVGYLEADRTFHLTLLARYGNGRLVRIVDRLREQTRLHGLPNLIGVGGQGETTLIAEHEQILAALTGSDPNEVERLMRSHLRHTRGIWAGLNEDA
ncbi:MAG TPA: GntR family transcriptional regulator [Gaiellaceae bacterium]|jgi:DNA-binding GntR family transcriptional regulator|nr:GntR family transcriptional regulator [Gaiellaceae bacterium]